MSIDDDNNTIDLSQTSTVSVSQPTATNATHVYNGAYSPTGGSTSAIYGMGNAYSYPPAMTGPSGQTTFSVPATSSLNGLSLSNTIIGTSAWTQQATVRPGGTMQLTGEQADILINDVSLMKTLRTIQERLNILTVNQKLENEWEELAELGNRYRELEKSIKEKMGTWEKISADYSKKR